MLQFTPENDVKAKPFDKGEDALVCAQCGAFVTRRAWALPMDGRAEHFCVNPHGIEFRVLTFSEAPGARAIGNGSTEATWFPGYAWRMAVCGACDVHLGWRFEHPGGDHLFFGLIHEALADKSV